MKTYVLWAQENFSELFAGRIAEIEKLLPPVPEGLGRPCTDRDSWDSLLFRKNFASGVKRAEKFITEKFPPWSDEAYLDFSRTGKRPTGEKMLRDRYEWLCPLVISECLENRGRYIPAIEMVLCELANEKTWILPAHDKNLDSFFGREFQVDLDSAKVANDCAQALFLMGSKLSSSTRELVLDSLEKKIFGPFRKTLKTGKGHWWLKNNNNWNAVCLAGVTGAALACLPGQHDRAIFVAAAEFYSKNYLKGFSKDGYCVEGLGYWNFGFSHFVILREELWQASKGKIDLFQDRKIRNIAMFAPRMEIQEGVYPAFSDCHIGTKPDVSILEYCSKALGLNLLKNKKSASSDHFRSGNLVNACMDAFPGASTVADPTTITDEIGIRSYFPEAGVLVARPGPDSLCQLGIVIKPGIEGSHCHHDAGSYVIVSGKKQLTGDPGGPWVYNSKTFGPERFTLFKLLNSYGHPVPVISGKLQSPHSAAKSSNKADVKTKNKPKDQSKNKSKGESINRSKTVAKSKEEDNSALKSKILATSFSDQIDEISIDLSSEYQIPKLKKLVRKLTYCREGHGKIIIEDRFAFSAPQTFEVPIITYCNWRQVTKGQIELSSGTERISAEIEAPSDFDVIKDSIIESNTPEVTRLGIKLKRSLSEGKVKITFSRVNPNGEP
ncbi:MAG: hypothetical protein HQM08_11235 [Candidatus Riflebacteria bacterium]|nr:hypothetical protein [Candidatus Riflebacteria bacterium]